MSETRRDDDYLEGLPPAIRETAEAYEASTKEPARRLTVVVDRLHIVNNSDAGADLELPLIHMPDSVEVLDEKGNVRAFALPTKEDMTDSGYAVYDRGRLKMYIVEEGGRIILKVSYNAGGWAN